MMSARAAPADRQPSNVAAAKTGMRDLTAYLNMRAPFGWSQAELTKKDRFHRLPLFIDGYPALGLPANLGKYLDALRYSSARPLAKFTAGGTSPAFLPFPPEPATVAVTDAPSRRVGPLLRTRNYLPKLKIAGLPWQQHRRGGQGRSTRPTRSSSNSTIWKMPNYRLKCWRAFRVTLLLVRAA